MYLWHPTVVEALPHPEHRAAVLRRCYDNWHADTLVGNMILEKDIYGIAWIHRLISSKEVSEAGKLLSMYRDYRNWLPELERYSDYLRDLGLPVNNYPKYMKPSLIKHYHDLANRDVIRARKITDKERRAIDDKNIRKLSDSEEYTDLLFDGSSYEICPVRSADDLTFEGTFLSHCVETYIPKVAAHQSYIYFLRKKEEPDTPYFTIEVLPKVNKITQCYTFHDTTQKPAACKKFIQKWAKEKHLEIACTV